jgi:hypothetical protein
MMQTLGLGTVLIVLIVVFFILLYLTFRPPAPKPGRLVSFLLLLGVTAALGYLFWTKVLGNDPNPYKQALANRLVENKFIDLTQVVPGLRTIDSIHRVDTDHDEEAIPEEWLVVYRYDVATVEAWAPGGPYGAAIYDTDSCRPPAILSYELAPRDYDYLGQDWAGILGVRNLIRYKDPRSVPLDKPASAGLDRPEVIIAGYSRGVMTDLNIFRKVGIDPTCAEIQAWRRNHPGQPFPYAQWLSYENVGSFRANYRVKLDLDTGVVQVWDRAGFERSQFTVRTQFEPQANGTYYQDPVAQTLHPVEQSLDFGPGRPDDVAQVYYPEKAVLAFYLSLGKDKARLDQAKSLLSDEAQKIYDIRQNPFGLTTAADSPARARDKLDRVLVYEIRYEPDIEAEQLRKDRQVTATVVGVNDKGVVDSSRPCFVTWTIIGIPDDRALPYGCVWKLDWYESTCPETPPKSGD